MRHLKFIRDSIATFVAVFWFSNGQVFADEMGCSALDSCVSEDEIWLALQSSDRATFRNAFLTLRKKDSSKLYSQIRDLTFDDSKEDEVRAVMVAQVIAQARRKIMPREGLYDYWKNWVHTANLEATESLIPIYLFFSFHQKLADKTAGSEKEISKSKRALESFLNNPGSRSSTLTEEAFTQWVEQKEISLASLPALLDESTEFLVADEAAVLREYFRILEITDRQTDNYDRNSYRLPFPAVLDSSILNKPMWSKAFANHLECGPTFDSYALMTQLAEIDPENTRLKSCLKERLGYLDDMPLLLETLTIISRYEALRLDRDLHEAVSQLDENHPFSSIRLARQMVLSADPAPEIPGKGRLFIFGPSRDLLKAINSNRSYCEPGPLGEFGYVHNSPDHKLTLPAEYFRMGGPVVAVKTPSGYLTGHDQGEFGGGLLYYADENSEPEFLHGRNMIAIIESEEKGIYWGLSGLNHMMPGIGNIYRIDARTDSVSVETSKKMPVVTRNVKLMETGDLFMDFWERDLTSFKNGERQVVTLPSSDFNPPVILTRAGEIKAACGD